MKSFGVMSGFEELQAQINEMQQLQIKYEKMGYVLGNESQIKYQDPENDEQRSKARKSYGKNAAITGIVTVLFLAVFIAMIVTHSKIGPTILVGLICGLLIYLFVKDLPKKHVQIMKATAIYKYQRMSHSGSSSHRTYTYFISVIPQDGEKLIFRDIQVSSEDYYKIEEGTPVMVVKGGNATLL